jgi:hypothetical protein
LPAVPGALAIAPADAVPGPCRAADAPIDLSEYPAEPDDILPATRQVRRLLALEHALENLPRYVEAMRRLLARPRPVIARALPPAFNRLPVTRAEQVTLTELHEAAVRENPDTS